MLSNDRGINIFERAAKIFVDTVAVRSLVRFSQPNHLTILLLYT